VLLGLGVNYKIISDCAVVGAEVTVEFKGFLLVRIAMEEFDVSLQVSGLPEAFVTKWALCVFRFVSQIVLRLHVSSSFNKSVVRKITVVTFVLPLPFVALRMNSELSTICPA